MNPSQYSSVGGGVALLGQALMYLTHWPLQALTEAQAMAFAGLIVLCVGSLHGVLNAWNAPPKADELQVPVKP